MYWLLDDAEQERIREIVLGLTTELSTITDNPQIDQYFPYVGRKDRRKAEVIVNHLSSVDGAVCDPFSGSGSLFYAMATLRQKAKANEWEPYANRISSAPWRLPNQADLRRAYRQLVGDIAPNLNKLYWTRCTCGNAHVLHSLFYDREPLRYTNVSVHERLGGNGENVTYRQKLYRCPVCGAEQKFFDDEDAAHMARMDALPVDPIFNFQLIENSRINLSSNFTTYSEPLLQ